MMAPTSGASRWRRLLGDDRGSASGWALGTMLVGLLMTGLVFDGGAAMTTKASALTVAQQAARAGTDQLDLATLRTTGEVQLDPAAAERVAAGWLEQADVAGTVSATTEQVTVTVTATGSAVLLSVVGITSYELSATATAEAIQP
jgi:hypothetical protein